MVSNFFTLCVFIQDNLEREVGRWREQCERLRNAHSNLQKENSSLREEAEMARFGQDSLQAEVSEWKTVADTATQERQEAIQAKESFVAEMAELKANVIAASDTHSQLEQALQAKSSLEAEIAELQKSANALYESNRNLVDANAEVVELKNEISILKQQLQSKQETASDIRMTELTDKIESLESQRDNLEHSLSEMSSENANLCEHIMSLQQKYDSISADLACKASSEYDNTQNFLHEKQALEEQVARITQNYENVKQDFEELTKVKSAFQTEVDELKLRLQEAHAETQKHERNLQQQVENEISLSEQLKAMTEAEHTLEQEVKLLQGKIHELQQLLQQTSTETRNENSSITESLERKLHAMLEEKEQILSVLNEKIRENGVLRSENQKLLAAMSNQSENHPATNSDQAAHLMQQLNQLQMEKDQLISTVQVRLLLLLLSTLYTRKSSKKH